MTCQLRAAARVAAGVRHGRPAGVLPAARGAAVFAVVACVKPKQLSYPEKLWTTRLLGRDVREHCEQAGHPSLAQLARGMVSKILSRTQLPPLIPFPNEGIACVLGG